MTEPTTLSKHYEPAEVEGEIYRLWVDSGAFHAVPDDREPGRRYVVMMPLPNVTGALHMGHAMDNVMQDLLIRWHRMAGDNTLWMPGTDHAGIATQAVVEKRLKELEGLTRHDVGREGLVDRIWRWKDQYQARIVAQQQRMGCSCDWRRQRFTMDAVCARAVRHAFFRMFVDGLVFRGKRLVNWDPFLRTTISDDEVYHETVAGHFWHLQYPVIDPRPGEPTHVVVATTRPETMLGDTAVAVHPDPDAALAERIDGVRRSLEAAADKDRAVLRAELDALEERRTAVLPTLRTLRDMAREGRRVHLPLLDRPIPLVRDEWAKPELGSGCVKITPAHDPNDYAVWTRHRAEIGVVNILEPDGTLNAAAGPYRGLDRFVARDRVVADLDALGLIERTEDREIEVGHSDRSKTPIEPYLSDQWFVRMGDVEGGMVMGRGTPREHRSAGLVQAAMDAVTAGRVRIVPERYAKTYLDWLSEKRDWPISRQLWWGHRIPVWSRSGRFAGLDIDALCGALGEGAAARLARLDDDAERSVLFHGPGAASLPAVPAEAECRIDVCLLADDPAAVGRLEALGLVREADVLDTWFSSALWPFSTLGWPDPATAPVEEGQAMLGPRDGADDCLAYYYPGSCLVTARDIITLWVARMVLAGLYAVGDLPFRDVFIHANILDGKGERMSKSKGNGIDPVDIIETYGTDAMRYVLCDMQTGTQDIRLPVTAICPACGHRNDLGATRHGRSIFTYVCGAVPGGKPREGSCGAEFDVLGTLPELPAARLTSERFEIGRAFCTKLWNSFRFALTHLQDVPTDPRRPEDLALEDRWALDALSRCVGEVDAALRDYNPSGALRAAREFFRGDLCDWYLELIKPRLADPADPSGPIARQVLAFGLDRTLRLLHPFLPFITERLWQLLGRQVPERTLGPLAPPLASEALIGAPWPSSLPAFEDPALRTDFGDLQNLVRAVREVRAAQGLSPKQPLRVTLKPPAERAEAIRRRDSSVVTRLAGIETLDVAPEARRRPGDASKVIGDIQVLVHDVIDDALERDRLRKALAKVDKEIAGLEKRLGNPGFTDRAPPDVVVEVRGRLAEQQAARATIAASLEALGSGG
jgi:valyl-tRNA synthetase